MEIGAKTVKTDGAETSQKAPLGTEDSRSYFRATLRLVILLLASVGVYATVDSFPWVWRRIAWAAISSPVPDESGFYCIRVRNEANEPLVFRVGHLNDRKFKVSSSRRRRIDLRLDRTTEEEGFLAPGEEKLFLLPSYLDMSLGRLLVTAQGERRIMADKVQQKFQAFTVEGSKVAAPHPHYQEVYQSETYPVLTIEADQLHTIEKVSDFMGGASPPISPQTREVDSFAVFPL